VVSVYDGSDAWKQNFAWSDEVDGIQMLEQKDVLDFDTDGNTTEVTRSFYHRNALGSVMEITDMNQAVVVSYRYDPYGKVTITRGGTPQSSDPLGNHWTFTGRFLDEEAGLLYYRARYYDPATGRFLQRDPLGYTEAPNLFEYVASNPVLFSDATGLRYTEEDEIQLHGKPPPGYDPKKDQAGGGDDDDDEDDDDGPATAGTGGGQKPSGDDPDYRIPWDELLKKLREAETEKGPDWLRLKRIKKHRQRQGGRYGPDGPGGTPGAGGGKKSWWVVAGLTVIAIGLTIDPLPGDEVPAWGLVLAAL
jgi:RHS repeat-associated protein